MAKRKKRAASKAKATRRKTRKPAKSVRGKMAKRKVAKTRPKKQATKAKKRAVVTKMTPKAETVVVDIVEEPAPGVMVVTEIEATEIRGPSVSQNKPEESSG